MTFEPTDDAPAEPTEDRFRPTVAGQTMCLTCGALVDYLDGRVLHDGWHRDGGR